MTSEELVGLIRKRYEGNAHVVLEQVPDGTGMFQARWIDAAVFSLWPSKGLTRSAFEVKASRSDFIAELQNHLKHRWVQESFHEFWFVAPKDVIQIDELPKGAGWMYPRGGKLCIKKHCARNDDPKLDDVLLAAFMRAAWKEIRSNAEKAAKEYLANDKTYQEALLFRQAVELFYKKRGGHQYFFDPTAESILQKLEESTLDKEVKEEREQLLTKLGQFQRAIVSLFSIFAIVANRSLIERNELGEFIVRTFGGADEEALLALKELETHKGSPFHQKGYAELVDRIINWDREEHGSS